MNRNRPLVIGVTGALLANLREPVMKFSFARTSFSVGGVLLLLSLFLCSLEADAQATKDAKDKDKKTTKDKDDNKPSPNTAKYMTQLRAVFSTWDANNDNNADRDEMARACRGPMAKAFDVDADAKKLDQLGDFILFKLMDTNKDYVISKAEFEKWAIGHAEMLADQDEAVEKFVQKQKQLEKLDSKAKNYDKMKAELKKDQDQLEKLQDRLKAAQKQIQNAKRDDKNDNKKGKN